MKTNKRKIADVLFISAILACMTITFQNFTPNIAATSLKREPVSIDLVANALKTAETENKEKQVALNVDDRQIIKSFKKDRKPQTIEIESDIIDVPDASSALHEAEVDPELQKILDEKRGKK